MSFLISGVATSCPLTAASNHTLLVCAIPPGVGLNIPVTVNVSGVLSSSVYFSYSPPTITSFSPPTIRTDGTSYLTLYGTNFGSVTGVISVYGNPCPITSWLDGPTAQAICQPISGQGVNKSITLTTLSGTFPAAGSLLISYTPPVVTLISPPLSGTIGGQLLTINGTNFGVSGILYIGSSQCQLSGIGWTDNLVQCSLPAGQGVNNLVTFTAGLVIGDQQTTYSTYSYAAPAITGLTPASLASGAPLTITGTDFGQNTATTVYVGGLVCPMTAPLGSFSLRRIVCVMPANTGILMNVTIVVANQTSNTVKVNYFPTITNVTSSSGVYPTNNTDKSVVLTVVGVNFGFPNQTASVVTIGGVVCPLLVQLPTKMTCTLPSGSGTNWPLLVTVMGTASASVPLSYAAPTLTNISSTLGPAAGNQVLVLTGTNFGNSKNALTADPVIAIGASTCALLSYNDTMIICRTQPGSGTKLSVTVGISTLTSNALIYSYAPPSITSITPNHGPANGGMTITLTGVNFAAARCGQRQAPAATPHRGPTCCWPAAQSSSLRLCVSSPVRLLFWSATPS